jgi:hypothetical protein
MSNKRLIDESSGLLVEHEDRIDPSDKGWIMSLPSNWNVAAMMIGKWMQDAVGADRLPNKKVFSCGMRFIENVMETGKE